MNCPTCQSPEPRLHPATQAEGEVMYICPDTYHNKPKPTKSPVWCSVDSCTTPNHVRI